jgi:hypothetical protein
MGLFPQMEIDNLVHLLKGGRGNGDELQQIPLDPTIARIIRVVI